MGGCDEDIGNAPHVYADDLDRYAVESLVGSADVCEGLLVSMLSIGDVAEACDDASAAPCMFIFSGKFADGTY
jgi:hypothetical protein